MDGFEAFIVAHDGDDTSRLLLSQKEWPSSSDPALAGIDARKLAVNTLEARRKLRKKAPAWHAATSLVYPTSLCAEQCSSETTASYKAALAGRIIHEYADRDSEVPIWSEAPTRDPASRPEETPSDSRPKISGKRRSQPGPSHSGLTHAGRIADLTGGLGVDDLEFSKVASEVFYNEMDSELAAAARHNFAALGASGISVSCKEVRTGELCALLGGFAPDLVFIDPARRSSQGRKVFRLQDCSPDVTTLVPEVFSLCRHILLKLSPMADISLVVKELGEAFSPTGPDPTDQSRPFAPSSFWNTTSQAVEESVSTLRAGSTAAPSPGSPVREVHVVAAEGECKELLVWMDREWMGGYSLTCCEDGKVLSFGSGEAGACEPVLVSALDEVRWVFEPGKSLSKAGLFSEVCARLVLRKLGRHTHLYSIPSLDETGVGGCLEKRRESADASDPGRMTLGNDRSMSARLEDFGKVFEVLEILPLNKASLKDVGRRYPRSEVSAKNIPLTSDALRAKLKVKSGDDAHIFGVRIDLPSGPENHLVICRAVR